MLKNKFGKRLAGGIVSAAMLASAAASVLPGMLTASAAGGVEMLGEGTFENGKGLPWHTCVTQPAQLSFDITGGEYVVTIDNPGGKARGGASRWDCQLRHRKLTIRSGDKYHVHAEVTADHDGQIYAKISDLAGEWTNEVWHNAYGATSSASYSGTDQWSMGGEPLKVTKGETLIIDAEFEASTSLETAEFAFHFGGAGDHQPTDCFPEGTVLHFDNLSLENLSGHDGWVEADPAPEYSVHGNQVGYYPTLKKQATIHGDAGAKKTVYILDSTGKEVWKKDVTIGSTVDEASGMYCATVDFSDLKTEGTYYFSTDGKTRDSYDFKIGTDIYDGVTKDALNYFYQNRAGVPISEDYITSKGNNESKSALAHTQYGHNPDTAYLQDKWIKAYANDGSDVQKSNGEITASDGWYDAGDHGKYVVNGGISVWTLQNMYEWTLQSSTKSAKDKFADGSSSILVPETGNKLPDILDETLVELKFFEEMIVPSSYKMSTYEGPEGGKDTGKYAGMLFHKLHDSKWTGLAVHAWDYQEDKDWAGITRIVKPPSVCATLNGTACFAQAYRLFKDYDTTTANKFLEEAKSTYEAAKANPALFAPLDQAIGGGAYGDNEASDDFYWAACELYISTGDDTYLKDLESYKDAYKLTTSLSGGENSSTFTSFNWGNTAGLGTLSLYLNKGKLAADKVKTLEASIASAADTYLAQMEKEGFGLPYTGSDFTDPINIPKVDGKDVVVHGYEWGSNSMVINNGIVLAYAYNSTQNTKYLNGTVGVLDYLFGRNALDFSFVTGYGTYHCINPHHRLWSHENDKNFPYAPSGVLSGGPNAGMQDPYVAGMGYKRGKVASQLCYVDSIEAWSVNEVTINWNSPFAWLMSFIEDEYDADGSVEPDDPPVGETFLGDVDCNGDVNVADAVLLARFLAEDKEATVSAQGKLNAQCYDDGTEDITTDDLGAILEYLAGIIAKQSDLPKKP